MEINKLIVSALKPLGIVTAYQSYNGTDDKYIMYSVYNEDDGAVFDDEATEVHYNIQLALWCKNPHDVALYRQIKQLMKQNGFVFDGAKDRIDEEHYGKQMDFIYVEYL